MPKQMKPGLRPEVEEMLRKALAFGGVAVKLSPMIDDEKTITWRNERKWAHRKMHQRYRSHRVCSKRVQSFDFIFTAGTIFVNKATHELIRNLPSN